MFTDLMPGKEKSELGKELWEASGAGKTGPVRMLLQAGADPNFIVRTGLMSTSSPLVVASCRGHVPVVEALLEHPCIRVDMSVSSGWTALMWAAWYGQTEVKRIFGLSVGVNGKIHRIMCGRVKEDLCINNLLLKLYPLSFAMHHGQS